MAGIIDLIQNFNNNLIAPPNAYQPEKPLTIQDILNAQEAGTYTPEMYDKYLANMSPQEMAQRAYNKSPKSLPSSEDFVPFGDFLKELKTINRKKLTPDYINKEGLLGRRKYDSTPQGLFTDSFDAQSSKTLDKKLLQREYSDLRDMLLKAKKGDLDFSDDIMYNEVISPAGFDVLDAIRKYQEMYNRREIPETFDDLLNMRKPMGSA